MNDRRKFIRDTVISGAGISTGMMFDTSWKKNRLNRKKDNENNKDLIDWNFFDANCTVGRHLSLNENGHFTSEDLLAEMDYYGISEALVIDSLSRENHPFDGNKRVIDIASTSSRLHAAWSVLPSLVHETGIKKEDFFRTMKEQNVRALFLYPNQYFFTLSEWNIDFLLELASFYKVPIFINPMESNGRGSSDSTDWDGIVELCKRWPQLPVIISEGRIRRSQRNLYRALDTCENLHLELSAYWLHRGIEYITKKWGSYRLIFGSGWPKYGHHMTITNLSTAQISDEDKWKIAGGNIRKLLGWNTSIPKVKIEFPIAQDEFVEYGRTGVRPANMKFYDVHGHLGKYNAHYHVPHSEIESVIGDLDYYGVEKVCVFSFAGVYSDEVFGNEIVSDAVKKYPDRLIGFTLLNPNRGKSEMIRELERGQERGLRGIKLIPSYQGYPIEGPLIEVACQWANKHQQIIINHYWGSSDYLKGLLSKYPNACFITAHTTLEYVSIMRDYSNLYVCSVPLLSPRKCEEVVKNIGADRFLFGSDLLDLPIGWGLGPILFARISREQKKLILGENLKKILNIYSL